MNQNKSSGFVAIACPSADNACFRGPTTSFRLEAFVRAQL
jgi:hypothetical protein